MVKKSTGVGDKIKSISFWVAKGGSPSGARKRYERS